MNSWYYKGDELNEEDIPPKAIGFIYKITLLLTGQEYIGRKLLTKAHRRQKNKKIIRSRVDSDWRTYWSSSPELHSLLELHGEDNFKREILLFAFSKSHLNYIEEKFLYCVNAMESNHWLNSNIRSKVYKKNIIDKLNLDEMNQVLNQLNKS